MGRSSHSMPWMPQTQLYSAWKQQPSLTDPAISCPQAKAATHWPSPMSCFQSRAMHAPTGSRSGPAQFRQQYLASQGACGCLAVAAAARRLKMKMKIHGGWVVWVALCDRSGAHSSLHRLHQQLTLTMLWRLRCSRSHRNQGVWTRCQIPWAAGVSDRRSGLAQTHLLLHVLQPRAHPPHRTDNMKRRRRKKRMKSFRRHVLSPADPRCGPRRVPRHSGLLRHVGLHQGQVRARRGQRLPRLGLAVGLLP